MYKPEVDKYNIRQLQRYLARSYVDTYKVRRRFIWNYVACCEEPKLRVLWMHSFYTICMVIPKLNNYQESQNRIKIVSEANVQPLQLHYIGLHAEG